MDRTALMQLFGNKQDYSRVLIPDKDDQWAKVEDDFVPCFKGEELYHYTWYFTAPGVTEGAEVAFRHRTTGEIISRGHVGGHEGDWEASMEHAAGTVCPCDIETGSDIDLIIKPT